MGNKNEKLTELGFDDFFVISFQVCIWPVTNRMHLWISVARHLTSDVWL